MFSDGEWRFENNGGNDFKFPVLGEDWCCRGRGLRADISEVWGVRAGGLALLGCVGEG